MKTRPSKDKQQALQRIDRGLSEVRTIDRTAGRYATATTVHAHNVNRNLNQGTTQGQDVLIPIYNEFEEVSVLGPVQKAKRQNAKQASTGGPAAVTAVDLSYTRVLLDTGAVQQDLQRAKDAINRGDFTAADNALLDAQGGVIFEYVESNAPLLKASENLALARTEINQNRPDQAKLALQEACKSLDNFAKIAQGDRANQAKDVSNQISEQAKNLNTNKGQNQSTKKIDTRIDDLWNRVVNISNT